MDKETAFPFANETINRTLLGQDSIHTIKEDDFTKEEDETLHEESRELRNSSSFQPDSQLPRSQLDISITKVRSPRRGN